MWIIDATKAETSRRPTLVSIQILRAVAALAVVGVHASMQGFPIGRAGVDLFFVISGFIMIYTSGDAFGRPGAAWSFALRRITRIAPVYWFFTAAAIVYLVLRGRPLNLEWFAASFLFLPSEGLSRNPVIGNGWTLILEMLFYAAFSLCLLLRKRMGLSALFVFLMTLVLYGRIVNPTGIIGIYYTSPLLAMFLTGVMIGVARDKGIRITPNTSITLAVAAIAAFILPTLFIEYPDDMAGRLSYWYWIPASTLMVAAAALCTDDMTANDAITKVLVFLGDASYSIYIAHGPALLIFELVFKRVTGTNAAPASLVFVVGVTAGIVSYVLIERPVASWFRKRRNAATMVERTT